MSTDFGEYCKSLLEHPAEDLNVEIKNWLDLGDKGDQANLAQALLALANHGGGYVLIGFCEVDHQHVPDDEGRPGDLSGYKPDRINDLVKGYADPRFQCLVTYPTRDDGSQHPVVIVRGGYAVPIRAKKDGPEGKHVKQNTYYIRRPGPSSEPPQTAAEWQDLIHRCVINEKTALLDSIRAIMHGHAPPTKDPEASRLEAFDSWMENADERLLSAVASFGLPTNPTAARYQFAYALMDQPQPPSGRELLNLLRQARSRGSGAPMWNPDRHGDEGPYPADDGAVEYVGKYIDMQGGPSQLDFWRFSPCGFSFLSQELEEPRLATDPQTAFYYSLPIHRAAEAVVHAATMAVLLGVEESAIEFRAKWTGLLGRQLSDWKMAPWFHGQTARVDVVTVRTAFSAATAVEHLEEILGPLLQKLYEAFDFYELNPQTLDREVRDFRISRGLAAP